MKDYQRLQHTLWECKYHLVFIPKYRRKALFSGAAERPGARVSGPGAPQGVSGGGGAFTIGSCAYAGEYSA